MPQGCVFDSQGINWQNVWLWIITYRESTVHQATLTYRPLIDDFQVINDVKGLWWFCLTDRTCYLHGCLFCLTRGKLPCWLNIHNNL